MRLRADKAPENADRLESVEALFRAQVESGHREEKEPPPPRARGTRKKASAQLDLFGAGEAPARPK